MKIGVIGVGRCGLPVALVFEKKGFDVSASSYKEDYISNLKNKKVYTTEPLVKDLLKDSKIYFTTNNQEIIKNNDIIYVAVATPSLPTGDYDMTAIQNVINDLKDYKGSLEKKTLIIASTTNPEFCQKIAEDLHKYKITVIYSPLFVAQGSVFNDFLNQEIVIIGSKNYENFLIAKKIFSKIHQDQSKIYNLSFTAAEILKMTLNCWSTLKITWSNLIGQVLYKSGQFESFEEFYRCLKSVKSIGAERVSFGFGYGGPCLPRDNRSFVKYAEKIGAEYSLGKNIDELNNKHINFLTEFYIDSNKEKLPFYFSFFSYKPNVDIDEPSHQLEVLKNLIRVGFKIYIAPSEFLNKDVLCRLQNQFVNSVEVKSLEELLTENIKVFKIN